MGEKQGKIVKFCPKCGSSKLKSVTTPWRIHAALFQQDKCISCGFEGSMVEGKAGFRKEFLKKLEKGGKGDG